MDSQRLNTANELIWSIVASTCMLLCWKLTDSSYLMFIFRHLLGEDLGLLSIKELQNLEKMLEGTLSQARQRKVSLMLIFWSIMNHLVYDHVVINCSLCLFGLIIMPCLLVTNDLKLRMIDCRYNACRHKWCLNKWKNWRKR